MNSEVESILISAEARMKRRFQMEEAIRIKHAKVRKRNHPKRHGENKERSDLARSKAQKQRHLKNAKAAARKKYLAAARAFWRGERENHP